MKLKLLMISMLLSLNSQLMSQHKQVSVTDYGAVADAQILNTKSFQQAIDEVNKVGGGTVNVPDGKFLIGTVLLKDNVTLNLSEGAELIGSNYLKDYYNIDPFTDAVGQQRGNCLIGAKNANNIAITGKGWINGRGERMIYNDKSERSKRPFLIRIVDSKNLKIDGISIRNSAAWNIHLYQSEQIRVTNVRILSQSEGNGDGIDIDSSEDVYIANCDINAHDDAICFKSTSPRTCKNVKVENCKLSSRWGAVKFGTESMGNFEDIEVSNCYIYDTHGGGIKILSVDGSNIKNINIHDIEMNDVEMPLFIRLGARLNTYRNAEKQPVGSIDGIKIKNIQVHGKRWGKWRVEPAATMVITGLEDAKVKNVSIENFDAKMYYEGKAEHANKEVPEQRTRYPEFIFFDGHFPAYGAFIRHAENITLKNIKIQSVKTEQRHIIKGIDLKGLTVDGLQADIDKGAVTPFTFENSQKVNISGLNLTGKTINRLFIKDANSKNIKLK